MRRFKIEKQRMFDALGDNFFQNLGHLQRRISTIL